MLNSLSQTLLKATAPGVPDIYQGNELWDFSLVDPDNRRLVDFALRRRLLRQVLSRVEGGATVRPEVARELLANREDGRIKMFVTALALRCRREQRGLFSVGEYLPVEVRGAQQDHLFAFARRHGGRTAVVVVPRLITRLTATSEEFPLGVKVWGDTRLSLPGDGPARYRNLFTGEVLACLVQEGRSSLAAAAVLSDFPVALLLSGP
jgi:(1->4)-alpha-D-glucan 1-alpha-D-glucosylmutase